MAIAAIPTYIAGANPVHFAALGRHHSRAAVEFRRQALGGAFLPQFRPQAPPGTGRDLFAPSAENAQIFAVNRGKIGA
jgi:hypothetical protein